MYIQIGSDSKIELQKNSRQRLEVLLGETVTVLPSATVTQLDGQQALVSGSSIAPRALGPSRYRLNAPDGSVQDLRLFACEAACTDFIAGAARPLGHGDAADPRHVLRNVVTESATFDGTVRSLGGLPLANYGG